MVSHMAWETMKDFKLTRLAYFSALRVSSKFDEAGLIQQIITVLAFPPSESYKIGRITQFFPAIQSSEYSKAFITCPAISLKSELP